MTSLVIAIIIIVGSIFGIERLVEQLQATVYNLPLISFILFLVIVMGAGLILLTTSIKNILKNWSKKNVRTDLTQKQADQNIQSKSYLPINQKQNIPIAQSESKISKEDEITRPKFQSVFLNVYFIPLSIFGAKLLEIVLRIFHIDFALPPSPVGNWFISDFIGWFSVVYAILLPLILIKVWDQSIPSPITGWELAEMLDE